MLTFIEQGWGTITTSSQSPTPAPVKPTPTEEKPSTQCTLEEVASQIYTLINEERVKQGVNPLSIDPALTSLAEEHSESMVSNHFFGHERASGERDFGWGMRPGSTRGENIAKTPQRRLIPGPYLSLEEVTEWTVQCWMESPGHRTNILFPSFTRTGIGVSLSGEYLYITQIFEGP